MAEKTNVWLLMIEGILPEEELIQRLVRIYSEYPSDEKRERAREDFRRCTGAVIGSEFCESVMIDDEDVWSN